MLEGLLTSDPYNGVTMMGVRNIYDHMILKDCYEAGLISEDVWKSYLKRLLNNATTKAKEDNSEN